MMEIISIFEPNGLASYQRIMLTKCLKSTFELKFLNRKMKSKAIIYSMHDSDDVV